MCLPLRLLRDVARMLDFKVTDRDTLVRCHLKLGGNAADEQVGCVALCAWTHGSRLEPVVKQAGGVCADR